MAVVGVFGGGGGVVVVGGGRLLSVPTEAIQGPLMSSVATGTAACVAVVVFGVVVVGGGGGGGGGGRLLSDPTEPKQRASDVPLSPLGQQPVWLLLVVVW